MKILITILTAAVVLAIAIACEPMPQPQSKDICLGKITDMKYENVQVSGIGEYRFLIIYTVESGNTYTEIKHEPPRGPVIGGYLYRDNCGNFYTSEVSHG